MPTVKTEKANQPLVSIVILNWNGLEDTLACLDSVEKLNYENYETIVIDNGSEGSLKELEENKHVELVKNSVNKGFAGGEVTALPYTHGDYILLLNNDATIHPEAINKALKTFSLDESIAVVGSKSFSLDENGEKSHGFYSFQRIDPITAEVSTYTRDNGALQDTATVSGSGVLIKRSAIDKVGYFDERFFAYYEETDLFARFLRAGLRVVYDPSFIIWHKDGASTKDKKFMYYYLMLKNQFLFAYKNFDKKYLKEFRKTYFRNFRRSLWVYLKDRSNTEAIHKARIRSTVWNILNILGTISSRRSTLSINPSFNYSEYLLSSQCYPLTVIIDATNENNTKDIEGSLNSILSLSRMPSEIVIISKEKIKIPKHSTYTAVRNIIDKNKFNIDPLSFGFMSSDTDILVPITVHQIRDSSTKELDTALIAAYTKVASDEAALIIAEKKKFHGSDIKLTNGRNVPLFAIRKSDLVDFLVTHDSILNLNNASFGEFINWCVMECKPVARIGNLNKSLIRDIRTPISSYPILRSHIKWTLKKSLRTLHLSRVFSKLRKIVLNQKLKPSSIDGVQSSRGLKKYSKKDMLNTPIIINTRDRVEPLKEMVRWLESTGHTNIAFIDNDSTYPELLDYFENSPHQVIQLGRNGMHKAPWESFGVRFLSQQKPYIITDPDILPTPETPKDTIEYLYSVLYKNPTYDKAGVALKIDDLPDFYQMKKSVIEWESRFWSDSLLLSKDVYAADLDTTFALYKPNTWWFLSPSIRVGGKYTMRHEPWYQDLDNPTNDMMYYRARASHEVSTWTKGRLPKHHIRALKKEGLL